MSTSYLDKGGFLSIMVPGIHRLRMVVMKRFLAAVPITICFILLFLTPVHAAKSALSTQYSRAVRDMNSFMDSESKKKHRSAWDKHINAFLAIAEKNPKSSLADDALLKAGEGYLDLYAYSRKEKDVDRAVGLLEKVVTRYPKSNTADKAMFRLGEISFSYRQDLPSALNEFQKFIKKYPKSPLVKDARKQVQKLSVQMEQDKETRHTSKKAKSGEREKKRTTVIAKEPSDESSDTDSSMNDAASETPTIRGLSHVKSVRHWSNDAYTRVVIDLDNQVTIDKSRLYNPDRLYFDIHNARLDSSLEKKPLQINDGILKSARVGQFTGDTVRLVLDLDAFQTYQVFPMENPHRLVIDVVAKGGTAPMIEEPAPATVQTEGKPAEPVDQNTKTEKGKKQPKPSWTLRNWAKAPASPPDTPSLARQLGLGVRRIVIDAGHGGNDPGAVGPTGLREKDVVLDIAMRLAKLVKAEITEDVTLTRKDDTFIPLEERTAIANKHKADLFVSIHANASRNKHTRGVETYLLNLTSNKDAMEVAARENQASMKTMGDLGGVLKDIMKTTKKDESLHLAHHVQKQLVDTLDTKHGGSMNLGVKEAPFWVLIGAQMPSVLTEVGFMSNEDEEERLASAEYRQQIAEALLKGIRQYVDSVSPKVAEAQAAHE